MDLILTGRPVSGEEALRMGLANRLVEPGQALAARDELGRSLTLLPRSACAPIGSPRFPERKSLAFDDAMVNETGRGMEVVPRARRSPERRRFARGDGRHGRFPGTRE